MPFRISTRSLLPWRRALERAYRSGWGPALYYLVEMWWLRMFFPGKAYMGSRRPVFVWDGVFVVATANRIDGLPPEVLRKGRFDEIFFIDLPEQAERREIFRIHLQRRRRDPAQYELETLAALTDGFSGAEIEQVVIAGLYEAFGEGVDLGQQHLVRTIRETFPLSVTMRDEIARLRRRLPTRSVKAVHC